MENQNHTTGSLQDALGGEIITVHFSPVGGVKPDPEDVLVRHLRPNFAQKYLQVLGENNEEALVELVCGKPSGWAAKLTRESFEQIVALDEKINLDFFSRCGQRARARMEKLVPGQQEKIVRETVQALVSQLAPSLPKLPKLAAPQPTSSPIPASAKST